MNNKFLTPIVLLARILLSKPIIIFCQWRRNNKTCQSYLSTTKILKSFFLRDDDDGIGTVRDVTSRDSALPPPAGRSRHVTAAVPRVLVVVPGWVG